MTEARILNLATEVQLALEVMPCQAMRQVYEPGAQPHPCAYFGEWGRYHSYDYATAGPPDRPGIEAPLVYAGKTALVPEILSGCRKAPIMAVGINPNLPGYWPSSRNAINPLFEDFLQYAHYFRYRSVAKLQGVFGAGRRLHRGALRAALPTSGARLIGVDGSATLLAVHRPSRG